MDDNQKRSSRAPQYFTPDDVEVSMSMPNPDLFLSHEASTFLGLNARGGNVGISSVDEIIEAINPSWPLADTIIERQRPGSSIPLERVTG